MPLNVNENGFLAKDGFLFPDQIISVVRSEGYEIAPRTFLYYIQVGLPPKGNKKGYEKGGVLFFYPASTVSLIKIICELKAKGRTLESIREFLSSNAEPPGSDTLSFSIRRKG